MEVIGKSRRKNKLWVTDEILDMCDKRRELNNSRKSDQAQEAANQFIEINKDIREKQEESKKKPNKQTNKQKQKQNKTKTKNSVFLTNATTSRLECLQETAKLPLVL